ncbi:large proline-rich protein BAG6-like [Selaginella moellendorffii]|uniref:large proline-rich protein BAG6-like n=1 Tax=Selaginella moellendorffii TaxID=88036 RepID=UPI000D1C53CD|nr:large proline-rich protein BAG6-like [Selaginella moellendorffii]|eukprot:XP_024524635.1 large proline-rich protein BAG6-like [Selaginella moellendorffii]
MSSGANEGEAESSTGSGSSNSSTVEIRIRTLDSASHTVRVNKDISVPALKEQLQELVGIPAQDQRLICRGRVLKDDQLLSAYNVEDGHTLHLVARPQPQSGETQAQADQASAQGQADPNQQGRGVTHSLVVGTINVPTVGDGGIPDFNRIVSAVLGSVGNLPGSNVPMGPADLQQGTPLTAPRLGLSFGGNQGFQVPPDALTTMAIYLSRMEQMFGLASAQPSNQPSNQTPDQTPNQTPNPPSNQPQTQNQSSSQTSPPALGEPSANGQRSPPAVNRPLFSPAGLGGIIRRAQSLLTGQAAVLLAALAGQLENEVTLADVNMRGEVQAAAAWSGTIMQQLGALLMELGRTTMTLHMGSTPAEAFVNSGPAVFVSPTGPNQMMVQPMPFQPIGTFPARSPFPPGWPGAQGPRSLNIHIHTSDTGVPSTNAPAAPSTEEGGLPQQPQVPMTGIPAGVLDGAGQENVGDDNSQGIPSAVVQETIMVIQDNGDARVLSSRSRNLSPGASPADNEGTVGANSSVPMQAAPTAQMAQVSQALNQLWPGGLANLRAPQHPQQFNGSTMGMGSNPLTSMLGATLGQLAGFQTGNFQVPAPFSSQVFPQGPAPPTTTLAQAQVSIPQQPASVPAPQPSPSETSSIPFQPPSLPSTDSRDATNRSLDQTATTTSTPTAPQPSLNLPAGLGLGRLRPLVPRRRTESSSQSDPAARTDSRSPPPTSPSLNENNFASLIGNIIRTPAFGNLAQQMMQTLGEGGAGSQNVDIGSIMQPMLRSVIQHQQQQPANPEVPEYMCFMVSRKINNQVVSILLEPSTNCTELARDTRLTVKGFDVDGQRKSVYLARK